MGQPLRTQCVCGADEASTLRVQNADLVKALEQAKADLTLITQNRDVGPFGLHALLAPAWERVDAPLVRAGEAGSS